MDLRRARCAHRRHPGRCGRGPATAAARPGPRLADQTARQGGLASRPRIRDRHAEDCVRARPADQGRTDARAGQALAARTYADLAALIADIPARPAARPARHPALAHRRPLARAAVKAGICLIVAAAALWGAALADPGGPPNPSHSRALPLFVLAQIAALAVPVILAHGVVTSWKLRRSRRQLPRRPGPGGYALDGERRASTGHGPVPPGLRTDQDRADLRADKSRENRQRISARAGRAPRGVRPSPGAA